MEQNQPLQGSVFIQLLSGRPQWGAGPNVRSTEPSAFVTMASRDERSGETPAFTISTGGLSDWHDDASVFDRRPMDDRVGYIDAHLVGRPL